MPNPSNNEHHRRVRDAQLALWESYLGRPLRAVLRVVAALVLLAGMGCAARTDRVAVRAAAPAIAPSATTAPTLMAAWDMPLDSETGVPDYAEWYLVKQGPEPGVTTNTYRVDSAREYRFVPADPAKVSYWRVSACRWGRVEGKDLVLCSPDSAEANTSEFVVPTDECAGAVVVSVGSWTSPVTAGDSAQVFWSVGRSKQPIVKLTVFLDGVAVPTAPNNPNPKVAPDLRGFLGSNFRVPAGSGTHMLSIEAESDSGCKAAETRLMPLVVR